jgi:hypothetical protein
MKAPGTVARLETIVTGDILDVLIVLTAVPNPLFHPMSVANDGGDSGKSLFKSKYRVET